MFLIITSCFSRVDLYNIAISIPDINIKLGFMSLPNETGNYFFGSVEVNNIKSETFTIENKGLFTLYIDSIYFLEDNVSQFQLDTLSMSSVVEPAENTSFTIKFKPTSIDIYSVTLIVKSNDPYEEIYSIKIDGEGTGSGIYPDINIKQGSTDLPNGSGTYHFGTIEIWKTSSVEFVIENIGTADLYISDVGIDTGDIDQFSGLSPSIPCNLAPGDSSTFIINFLPTDSLYYSATINITNDDPDEASYTFIVDGTGSDIPAPDILVEYGSFEISNMTGKHNFGWVEISDSNSATFNIENTGTDTLNITSISVNNITSKPNEFNVSPISMSIMAGETQNIIITFSPVMEGDREAEIIIESNDPDESPYTFTVIGTGVAVGTFIPDIFVKNEVTSTEVPNGSIGHDFVDVLVGASGSVRFIIENTGTGDLNLTLPIVLVSSDISDFGIDDSSLTTVLLPGDTTYFDVVFSPTSTGNKEATIKILNNDLDENPYSFTVIGKGTLSSEPEINILIDSEEFLNGSTYNFGSVTIGNSTSASFVIENKGSADLNVSSLLFVGGQAADFSHDLQVPINILAGDSKSFQVEFIPTSTGIQGTSMQIQNDDSDENPYTITLKGTGI